MSERGIKILCVVLAAVLVVLLVGVYISDEEKKQEFNAAYEEYEKKTEKYKTEAEALAQELSALKEEYIFYGDDTKLMIGFAVADTGDIPYIRQKANKYGFSPVIVLDCTMDSSKATAIIEAADKKWEIMLYLPSFADDSVEKLSTAKSALEKAGRKDCGVAFCRIESIAEKELEMLESAGFLGYTVYNSSPLSGQSENGMIYFDFSRITSAAMSVTDRLSLCYVKSASMMYIFDMASIESGAVNEEAVAVFMQSLADYAQKEKCGFATVSETVSALSQINAKKAEEAAFRAERIKEIETRIEQLDAIIMEISAECFA